MIIFKISVSLFKVPSDTGVSMRIAALPSRVSSSATWTSAVGDSEPVSVCRLEPDARLITRSILGELLATINGSTPPTVVFPLPVVPMTVTTVRVWTLGYARDPDRRGRRLAGAPSSDSYELSTSAIADDNTERTSAYRHESGSIYELKGCGGIPGALL